MLISNMELIPGRRVVEHLGLVQGSSVRAKHVGRDIMAGLKNIVGGEISEYTKTIAEGREEAQDRMIAQAAENGGNERFEGEIAQLGVDGVFHAQQNAGNTRQRTGQ